MVCVDRFVTHIHPMHRIVVCLCVPFILQSAVRTAEALLEVEHCRELTAEYRSEGVWEGGGGGGL